MCFNISFGCHLTEESDSSLLHSESYKSTVAMKVEKKKLNNKETVF